MGDKSVVRTETAPAPFQGAPYSQAIKAAGLVFVSGQLGLRPGESEMVGEGIQEQTEQVFANLRAILEGAGSGLGRAPSREALLRLEQVKADVIRVHSGNGFHLADTGDLIRTCVIEAVLAAVVITVSAVRRRHRWGRRTAAAARA